MNPVTYNALRGEQTFPLPSHVDFVIEITGYAKKTTDNKHLYKIRFSVIYSIPNQMLYSKEIFCRDNLI